MQDSESLNIFSAAESFLAFLSSFWMKVTLALGICENSAAAENRPAPPGRWSAAEDFRMYL